MHIRTDKTGIYFPRAWVSGFLTCAGLVVLLALIAALT